MQELRVEAHSPEEIAKKIAAVAEKKSALDSFRLFVLAVMAGAFIAFGAEFFTLVTHDSGLAYGLNKLLGGFVFSLGLILVVLGGAELFTGNTLMVMGYVDGLVSARGLLRNWFIAYMGNLVGALFIVFLVYNTGQWTFNGTKLGAQAVLIANAKTNLTLGQAFFRGILGNSLVCLAVWLCVGARTTVDKIMAAIFPITAFVASGFEHCIANMYFVPMGIILKSCPDAVAAANTVAGKTVDLGNLTVWGFVKFNLIPVTIGNVLGGSLLVGLVYWSVYLREFSFRSFIRLAQVGFRLVFFVRLRDLTPAKIAANLTSFRGIVSRKKGRRRPKPRDLTTLVADSDEKGEDGKN